MTGFVGMAGTWQHGPAATGPWTAITTPTEAAPAVLGAGEFVRFLPARGKTGYAGLRFQATDGGLFSPATDTAWAPVGGTTKFDGHGHVKAITMAEDPKAVPAVKASALVAYTAADFPASTAAGVAVTGVMGSGSWEVNVGKGWVALGGVSEFEARLLKPTDSIRFIPAANWNGEATMTYRAWKVPVTGRGVSLPTVGNVNDPQSFSREAATAAVTVTPVNDAPTLDLSIPRIFSLESQTVAQLVDGSADIDSTVAGIAVTRATAKNGRWEYRLANGDWKPFPTVPAISSSAALLLDLTAQVRFTPKPGAALVTGAFDYKVRDDSTTFRAGTRAATTTTAYSKAFETATYSFGNHSPEFKLGDAPVISIAVAKKGFIIDKLIARQTDADAGALKGIAITGLSGAGLWEHSLDGVTWNTVGDVANSLLLRSKDRLRFTPAQQATGTATITFRAWDQTTGGGGDRLPGFTDAESLADLTATVNLI